MEMMSASGGWLSPAQVAARFAVSTDTIRRWGRTGRLREHRTPSGQRRYRAEDVEALAAGAPTSTGPLARAAVQPMARPRPPDHSTADVADVGPEPVELPMGPPSWKQRVLEAEAEVEVLKARHELEELVQARQRLQDVRAEKATAAAAAEQEERRLKNLKDQGRLHAILAGVPPVWRAKVGRELELYVTSKHFPPGLSDAEAIALVKKKVEKVLRPYRKKLADAEEEQEDRLRVESLIKHGKSRAVTNTLLWDQLIRDDALGAVDQVLKAEVEADWTEADVSEMVDEILEGWEEEKMWEEEDY